MERYFAMESQYLRKQRFNGSQISVEAAAVAGFDTSNPIVSAVLDTVRGVVSPVKVVKSFICDVCMCPLSCEDSYRAHLSGIKHRRKLQEIKITNMLTETRKTEVSITPLEDQKLFNCSVCKMTMNSARQMETHLDSSKHSKQLKKFEEESAKAAATKGKCSLIKPKSKIVVSEKPKCSTCSLTLNSVKQYEEHLLSKKHLLRAKSTHPYSRPTVKIVEDQKSDLPILINAPEISNAPVNALLPILIKPVEVSRSPANVVVHRTDCPQKPVCPCAAQRCKMICRRHLEGCCAARRLGSSPSLYSFTTWVDPYSTT